ncbi:MAG: nucleotide-binding protein [Cytophagaceae bacterium]|nr:nucleotide-binding protein [Cytophagaceae bacterium]
MPEPISYRSQVFINCPFDDAYKPLFRAIVFTVHACGFTARCAQEDDNSADVRIHKIIRIIDACHYGIHDISKADLDDNTKLARFNMPLELGIFIGAHHFAPARHYNRNKKFIVMDSEPFRYQKFISDINGQDIKAHELKEENVIWHVRDFLATSSRSQLPGANYLLEQYELFKDRLPAICQQLKWTVNKLTFINYVDCTTVWLNENPV